MSVVTADADPVLVRRAKAARLTVLGRRIGYLLYGVAIVVFFLGLLTSFNGTVATLVIGALTAGSIVLAPAIIAAYAVKAAIRDDVERGRAG